MSNLSAIISAKSSSSHFASHCLPTDGGYPESFELAHLLDFARCTRNLHLEHEGENGAPSICRICSSPMFFSSCILESIVRLISDAILEWQNGSQVRRIAMVLSKACPSSSFRSFFFVFDELSCNSFRGHSWYLGDGKHYCLDSLLAQWGV